MTSSPHIHMHIHAPTCTYPHEHIQISRTQTDTLCRNVFAKYVQKKKNLIVNFGTGKKISPKDGGILTEVREQAGLLRPCFVVYTSKGEVDAEAICNKKPHFSMVPRSLFTFQKCPREATSKARKTCGEARM